MNLEEIFERNVPGMRQLLHRKTVAIAGCGGLGSNAAVTLVRAGLGKLIIVDHDTVELSNLNRQYYFLQDLGKTKIEALAAHLKEINPGVVIEAHFLQLTPAHMGELFEEADLLIEAFDRAESKAWLLETWCALFPERPAICASGLAGYGDTSALRVRRSGNLVICGDEKTDQSMGLTSSRVAIAANMEANIAIEILMNEQ